MAALRSQMETLLAVWNDATTPLDARVREDAHLFLSESAIVSSTRFKRLKGPTSSQIGDFCRPWEHDDFLERVSSFSIALWFAKPDIVSVFECARHGWRNSALDQLYCTCCKQFLCFNINSKLSETGVLKVAKTFADQLVTGHTQLCPWRGNPSPEAFTMLPIATKRQVCEMFIRQLEEEVARMHNDIEFQKQMESIKIEDAVIAKIMQEANGSGDGAALLDIMTLTSKLVARISKQKDVSVNPQALMSAAFVIMCGWKFDERDGTQADMLYCGSCNRRWQIHPGTVSKGGVEEGEPPAKRLKVDIDRSVNLLSQHRHFCPWIVGRKPAGVDDYGMLDPKLWEFVKLPGWKQNAQALVLLGNWGDRAIIAIDSSDAKEKKASDPEQALATIQAVLGL
ncbi:unnamed protein product [Peronospora farinosa]|uniref:C3HC-type domain-containing protein n=1 Tax=Peronospora farinosa TaxID=134698 RepID=A0AAV0SQD8_9STRA|nr:unnamed protein product [Peronospora farinosa]